MRISLPQRVPQNVAGDFYVEANLCTRCCLVHGEAPELLNDPEQPFEECFFRRQPETSEEIDRAIDAVYVSEMCALRYGGTDPDILARFRARNAAAYCDHTPEGRACLKQRLKRGAHSTAERAMNWKSIAAIYVVAGLAVLFVLWCSL